MRLIDADKLVDNQFKNDISYNAFVNLVKRQPTVDAVPVVRCQNCKHHPIHGDGYCPAPEISMLLIDDEFCSYGEVTE